jgi:hypothetical protein
MLWRDGESESGDVLDDDVDKMAVTMMMTMTMMMTTTTMMKKCSGRLQPKRSIMYNELSNGRNTSVFRNDGRNEYTICKRRWITESLSSTQPDW